MSSFLLSTQVGALGNRDKGATSPPRGGGLRGLSRFLPRLGPWVTRIKVPLHHLDEVACELNLALYPGWGLG